MAEPFTVTLTGLRARRAPMTWGQRTQYVIYELMANESYRAHNLRWTTLPPDTSTRRIHDVLAALVTRHESLRTRFHRDEQGRLWQTVPESVEFTVDVRHVTSEAEASAACGECWQQTFDHSTDMPIRFLLVEAGDAGTTLVFSAAHMAVDGIAAAQLLAEIEKLVGTEEPVPAPWPGPERPQPVDRAAEEQSAAGRALSARNLDRWRQHMENGLTRQPALRHAGTAPRFWTGALDSPALNRALPIAARQLRATPAAVLLGSVVRELSTRLGVDPVPVRIAFNNRNRPPDDTSIEPLIQWGLACVEVGDRPPAQLVRAAGAEAMKAFGSARYDIDEVMSLRERLRASGHGDTMPQFFLNYTEFRLNYTSVDADDPAAADGDGGAELRHLLASSTFSGSGTHHNDSDTLYFLAISALKNSVKLEFLADTRLLAPNEIEASLRGIERWIVAAIDPAAG